MEKIAISKYSESEMLPQELQEQVRTINDTIRQRAFELFEARGCVTGSDLDDWLQAERELLWMPATEIVEHANDFRARIALPGLFAEDIQVSATPGVLILKSDSTRISERFAGRLLFKILELPRAIDFDSMSGTIDNGMLRVMLPKETPKEMAATA